MFARTKRLTLRPAWPEDAATLATLLADREVARMLARVPHPYSDADAAAFVAQPRGAHDARFLIVAQDRASPATIGGIGIRDGGDGPALGYWLSRDAWGQGYATEAGQAVVAMARHALPIRRLNAWYFTDNPASGAVLRKLGFRDTGRRTSQRSAARCDPAEAVTMTLDLAADCRPDLRIAA